MFRKDVNTMKSKTEKTETKRMRKRDSLPIIFAIALLVCLAVGGWRAKAMAEAPYTIVFDLNGHGPAATVDDAVVAENGAVTQPETPVDDDWEFKGWYLDSSCSDDKLWDFTTTLNNESPVFEGEADPTGFTLYAKWVPKAPVAASIFAQTTQLSIQYGETTGNELSVTVIADAPELTGHTVEYKWYKFTGEGTPVNNDSTGWTALSENADMSDSLTVSTDDLGTTYYYCTVYSHRTALDPTDYVNSQNYYAMTASSTMTVEVTKREITVSGITAEDKEYDGTKTATLVFDYVDLEGLIPGDDLAVTATGTFEDADAGEDKVVTITGLTLSGDDVDKYVLASTGQQTETNATINPASIDGVTATITGEYIYTGSQVKPTVVVKRDTQTLKEGVDYTIVEPADGDWIDVGTYYVTVKSKGNYGFDDIDDLSFEITPATLSISHIKLVRKMTYNGEEQTPQIKITYGDTDLTDYFDYDFETYGPYKNAGSHRVKITAKDSSVNVTGSLTPSFTIYQKEVTVSGITAKDKTYDGTDVAELNVSGAIVSGAVGDDNVTVKSAKGKFATVNAGTGITVTITEVELSDSTNYKMTSAQTTTTANINKKSITPIVTVTGSYSYTGKAITPTYTIGDGSGGTVDSSLVSVTVSNNINAGTGLITVSELSNGNITFTRVEQTFTIEKATKLASNPGNKSVKTTKGSTVSDISPEQIVGSKNASNWKWKDSDGSKSLVAGEAVTATMVYCGSDADNYTDAAKEFTVTITKTGSSSEGSSGNSGSGSGNTRRTGSSGSTTTGSSGSGSSKTGSGRTSSGTTTSSKTGSSNTSSRLSNSTTGSRGSLASSDSELGSGSTGTVAKPPFIEGDPSTSGWPAIIERIEAANNGESVPIYMNGTTLVPAEVFQAVQGRNVTVVFDMGNSVIWNVNGVCVKDDALVDTEYAVFTNTNSIPAELVAMIAGSDYTMQISLTHDGDFGCSPILNLNLGSNNAGLYANLFYYDPANNSLEYVTADEIKNDGSTALTFSHASDYLIVADHDIMANASAHLDTPETFEAFDDAAADTTSSLNSIADPNSTHAYVQSDTVDIEDSYIPRSDALARRLVAPEKAKLVKLFWLILILLAMIIGAVVFLLMNREQLAEMSANRAARNNSAAPAVSRPIYASRQTYAPRQAAPVSRTPYNSYSNVKKRQNYKKYL